MYIYRYTYIQWHFKYIKTKEVEAQAKLRKNNGLTALQSTNVPLGYCMRMRLCGYRRWHVSQQCQRFFFFFLFRHKPFYGASHVQCSHMCAQAVTTLTHTPAKNRWFHVRQLYLVICYPRNRTAIHSSSSSGINGG